MEPFPCDAAKLRESVYSGVVMSSSIENDENRSSNHGHTPLKFTRK